MKKIILTVIFLVIILVCLFFVFKNENTTNVEIKNDSENKVISEDDNDMVKINIDGVEMDIVLEDNDTAKAFADMLPLEFTANDLNSNEKYYYLDKSLPSNSRSVKRIEKGDVMLFGDDCLVIFYESFNTTYSYTKIGKISDANLLDNISSGNVKVVLSK